MENSPRHTSETPLDPVASAAPSIAQPQTEVNPTQDADAVLEQRADYRALEQRADWRALRIAAARGEIADEAEYGRRLAEILRSDPALEFGYNAKYGDDYLQYAEQNADANTAPGEGNGTQDSGADAKISTPGKTDGPRFSIETIGGEPITVIDTQNDTREFAAAERYLKTLVDAEHPFSTILSDAQPVYLGKDLPGEYRESEYTKTMLPRLRTVKMQAATNLDEMLLLAENGEWRENVKPKHARDAKNGWYRYET